MNAKERYLIKRTYLSFFLEQICVTKSVRLEIASLPSITVLQIDGVTFSALEDCKKMIQSFKI